MSSYRSGGVPRVNCAVIDSNMLQSPSLRAYFLQSPDNALILADFVWIEIYKQKSVVGLSAAFSVIRDFPDRLYTLKTASELAVIDPASPDLVERMLGDDTAERFRMMNAAISYAERGEASVLTQLAHRWSSAGAHMDGMLEGAADIVESLPEIAEIFSADELRRCRTNARYTSAMFEKIFGAADQLYETFVEGYGASREHLTSHHRFDAYLYRYALAIMIYALWWIGNGSQTPKRLDRARNDIIDLGLAVYATYFAGLMSDDTKAHWMHANLSAALNEVGSALGLELAGLSTRA